MNVDTVEKNIEDVITRIKKKVKLHDRVIHSLVNNSSKQNNTLSSSNYEEEETQEDNGDSYFQSTVKNCFIGLCCATVCYCIRNGVGYLSRGKLSTFGTTTKQNNEENEISDFSIYNI